MTFSWSTPPCQHHNGEITSYELILSKDTGESKRYSHKPVYQSRTAPTTHTLDWDDIELKTNYTIRIAAVNVAGIGPFSTVQFYTNEGK